VLNRNNLYVLLILLLDRLHGELVVSWYIAQLCQVLSPSLRLSSSSSEKPGSDPVFFVFFFLGGRNFGKFRPEKYDFDLYKGFSIFKKKTQIRQIPKKKKKSRSPDFYDNLP
jgi:hypothetical protein